MKKLASLSWSEIEHSLRRLSYDQLFKEYQSSLMLCAKTPKELKLEVLLEEEIIRRSNN